MGLLLLHLMLHFRYDAYIEKLDFLHGCGAINVRYSEYIISE